MPAAVLVALFALQPLTPNTFTAPGATPGARATIDDTRWLAGRWTGAGLGGETEETWSAPAGGAMMGMFRLVRGGTVVFYEFLTLVEHEGSLVLKLKHFNADLTGWEEKEKFVTFRLLESTPDELRFDGLTFRRTAPDRVTIFLAIRNRQDGSIREETFSMRRASTPNAQTPNSQE